jgi:hypothetical protein
MKQLIPLALLLIVACSGRDHSRDATELRAYVGENLRTLDPQRFKEFQELAEDVTGEKPEEPGLGGFEAWWVKSLVAGDVAWVFAEAYPGYEVPDVSAVRIYFFDKHWKSVAEQTFPTGYRFFLENVELSKDNPLSQDLLVARVTSSGPFRIEGNEKHPAFEQGDFQRQYYGLLGGRFVLVRLEDNKRQLAQNHYRWRAPLKGPPVPKRSCEAWIRSLTSSDSVEQLASLVWFTGMHLPSTEPRRADHNEESLEDSKLFEAVRAAPETEKALKELHKSPNLWVQEYAELGLGVVP